MRKRESGQQGFTLMELLIAMVVLAIGLVGILKANLHSGDALVRSQVTTEATLLARQKMAEIELIGLEDWMFEDGDFGEANPGYEWEVQIEDTTIDKLKRVYLVVTWSENADDRIELEKLLPLQVD